METTPVHRVEVAARGSDARAAVRAEKIRALAAGSGIERVSIIDNYTIAKALRPDDLERVAQMLAHPVVEDYSIDAPLIPGPFEWAIEIGFLPGVTDNAGTTAREGIEDLLQTRFEGEEGVFCSQTLALAGDLSRADVEAIAGAFHNPLIQRAEIRSRADVQASRTWTVPLVRLAARPIASLVDLEISDEELVRLGREGIVIPDGSRGGPLALDLASLNAIREYFRAEGRSPTDLELESIAQTWSEHCKHRIFASALDDVGEGIFRRWIRGATERIRHEKGDRDFCVSVFGDNSGVIAFDDAYCITDKVETHNTPSALDPFGGAITGIVGVNRDAIGCGLGSKPVINRYGYCFADPDDREPVFRSPDRRTPLLSPRRILDGVVNGVQVGGNCSGIPTPQGFMYFDPRYKGKPLVFVGTVGLLPHDVAGRQGWEKRALAGDVIVVVGGRVGQDGIHGATFSSVALDEGSPATAVQIGDPITQKKLSDAIVKEARDLGLYRSITDNGAGGLSCSVAEMARESGGCEVELDRVPLKYPGLEPWKIWVSESQERMTLAVPPQDVDRLLELFARRAVEATVIGRFTDSGRCVVRYRDEVVMDVDLTFLHDGAPSLRLRSAQRPVKRDEPDRPCPGDLSPDLLAMMTRKNLASFAFISTQYDHEVQGGSALKPLQGRGAVNAHAAVTRPRLDSMRGAVTSQALYPTYGDLDPYAMAAAAIDTAVRNAIVVGADPEHLALLDNFCWCSSDEPERLGQLREAARACYETAVAFGTPFISGKDSMFNDFDGFDAEGKPLRISVPPTLLVSSLGVVEDVTVCVSLDAKMPGDRLYVIGATEDEMGGSEYYAHVGEVTRGERFVGSKAPGVDAPAFRERYAAYARSIRGGLVASAESVGRGGLGAAFARTAIGGALGLEIDWEAIPGADAIGRPDTVLFSESQGRIVVTVAPENQETFESALAGQPIACLGRVTGSGRFVVRGGAGGPIIDVSVEALTEAYRAPFRGY